MPARLLIAEPAGRSSGWEIHTPDGATWAIFDPGNPGDPSWRPSPIPVGVSRIIRSGSLTGWPDPAEPGNWMLRSQAQWPQVLDRLRAAHSPHNPLLLLPDARDLVSDAPGALRIAYGEDGKGSGLHGVALDPLRLLAGALRDVPSDRRDFLDRLSRTVVPRCGVLILDGKGWVDDEEQAALRASATEAGVPIAVRQNDLSAR